MKPNELFNLIKETDFVTVGDKVDFAVRTFPKEKRIRLIFEESNGKRDWINNFNFPIKPYKNQKNVLWYARGWAKAYKTANDKIMEKLIDTYMKNPDYDIEICGWSYGGAMALIATEDFYFRTKVKCIVTTFGAPKPLFGKKTKQTVLNCCKEINQYSNVNDLVTFLPPFLGYVHAKKTKVDKKKIFGIFKPNTYHCIYDTESFYNCKKTEKK